MDQPGFEYITAIEEHCAGFAKAASDILEEPVRHCPDWTVADLVSHLTEVHWFWATIAGERLLAPPNDDLRPPPAPAGQLIDRFVEGASHLTGVLTEADPERRVWTWAPQQQNIGFITRHQVQEAAVHHWDAVNAGGGTLVLDPALAADSIEEFLTFSVSSDADPASPAPPALDGRFELFAVDLGRGWIVSDGSSPGTVRFDAAASPFELDVVVSSTASDLLLWLYDRVELPTPPELAEVLARFRPLCFTN